MRLLGSPPKSPGEEPRACIHPDNCGFGLIVVPLGRAGRGAGSRGFESHRTHFSVGFQWVFSHQENAGFRLSVNLLETKGVNLHQLYATLLLNGSFPHTDKYEGRKQLWRGNAVTT